MNRATEYATWTALVVCTFLLLSCGPTVRAAAANLELCWTFGKFDATVYFAQAEVSEDRKESFDALLTISGIDHGEMQCVLNVDHRLLLELKRTWSAQHLEVVNTTFLSDLDY
jgi:hypothetical protein